MGFTCLFTPSSQLTLRYVEMRYGREVPSPYYEMNGETIVCPPLESPASGTRMLGTII